MTEGLLALAVLTFVVGPLALSRLEVRRLVAALEALAPELSGSVVSRGSWINAVGLSFAGRLEGRAIRSQVVQEGSHPPRVLTRHEVEVANAVPGLTLEVVDVLDLSRLLGGESRSREVTVAGDPVAADRLFQARRARDAIERLLSLPGVAGVELHADRIVADGWVAGREAVLGLFHELVAFARLCERQPGREGTFEWAGGTDAARCPYCHDALAADREAVDPCARCRTVHHRACLAEAGGCTVLGCRPLETRASEKT